MTASELAVKHRGRLQILETEGRKKGFEQISHGIVDHTDVYEAFGYVARQSNPQKLYDGLSLRIAFILFPQPCIHFQLNWTSWMADPSMKIRANYPPVILKEKRLDELDDAIIQRQTDRFLTLLAAEVARGQMPNFVERLWIRFAK